MYKVENPSMMVIGGSSGQAYPYSAYQPRRVRQGEADPSQIAGNALNIYQTINGGGGGAAVGGEVEAGTGAVSNSGGAAGLGPLGWIGGIGAAAATDQIAADNVGNINNPYETHTRNARGLLRYGGSSPLTTSLIDRGLGESGRKVFDKITDPTGVIGKVEQTLGHGVANTVPEILGGTGKLDVIGSYLFS